MSKYSKKMKRVLSLVLAIAMVVPTVLLSSPVDAEAAVAKKVIKSLTAPSSVTISEGSSKTVSAKVTALKSIKASDLKVKVSTNNKRVATASITKNPTKKAKTGTTSIKISAKKAGTAYITVKTVATNKSNKYVTKKIKVTVKKKTVAVSSVKVKYTQKALLVGQKFTLSATVNPSTATNKKLTYTSSQPAVATVSSTGVVTAKGAGTTTIKAKASNGKFATCLVTVSNPNIAVNGITLSSVAEEIAIGSEVTLSATVTPADASDKSVIWTTSDASVATVDGNGKVKAVAGGTAKITVTTNDGKYPATCEITVDDGTLYNAAKAQLFVSNSLKDYPNTVLTGTTADVKVLITNKKGTPVGNTSVTLDLKSQCTSGYSSYFGITGDNNNYYQAKVTTDKDGYAEFTVGLKGGYEATATDDIFESYTLTATVTGSDVKTEETLSFACIRLGGIDVINNDTEEYADLVPGENAVTWDGVAHTWSTNGARYSEYVNSQMVSSEDGKIDHSVYMAANPVIVIPAKSGSGELTEYYKELNLKSDKYEVYNTEANEKTTKWIKDVPAGLVWCTLKFDDIVLSKYTTLEIKSYIAGTDTLVEKYVMDEDNMKKDLGYQIPVAKINKTDKLDIEVSLISEGQVNLDSNDGYTIKYIKGEFDANAYTEGDCYPIGDVKWEAFDYEYDSYELLTKEDAINYGITDINDTYTYKYEVPSFPSTGDAYITVFDKNNKVVNYYAYPTENRWVNKNETIYPLNTKTNDKSTWTYTNMFDVGHKIVRYTTNFDKKKDAELAGNPYGKYDNKNAISLPGYSYYGKATKISKEEYENKVGTVTTLAEKDPYYGTVCKINSTKSGRTLVKATINLDSLGKDEVASNITTSNGQVLYSSVQWAPLPEEKAVDEGKDFYAMVTQNIVVKAQVVDGNGNIVSTAGKTVDFYIGENKITKTDGQTLAENSKVQVVKRQATSDANGQATIKFLTGDVAGNVQKLSAMCDGYKCQLYVGKNTVPTKVANLYWVDLGLSFTDRVAYKKSDESVVKNITSSTLDGKTNAQSYDKNGNIVDNVANRQVGTNWMFGYKVVGKLLQPGTDYVIDAVNGAKVLISKSDDTDMTLTTEGLKNGQAKVYSEKSFSAELIGQLNQNSFSKREEQVAGSTTQTYYAEDLTFTIKDEVTGEIIGTFQNVGEGKPALEHNKLSVNFAWTTRGKHAQIIFPDGSVRDAAVAGYAYIKVSDDFGNPIQNAEVKYAVAGVHKIPEKTVNTDANGLVKIELSAPGTLGTEKTDKVSVTVDGTIEVNETLSYKTSQNTNFAVMGSSLDTTNADNPILKVYFSAPVSDEIELKKEFFSVKSSVDEKIYEVESVKMDENRNVLLVSFRPEAKTIVNDTGIITVTVNERELNGIIYRMTDIDGRLLDAGMNITKIQPSKKFTVVATPNADNTKVEIKIVDAAGDAVTTLNVGRIGIYDSTPGVVSTIGYSTLTAPGTITVTPIETETSIYVYYAGAFTRVTVKKQS